MRVLVPYTHIRPGVLEAIRSSGYEATTADVSYADDAYARVLAEWWSRGEDFCVVEHDIVVGPDTLHSFDECTHLRCAAPYPYLNGMYPGLGCTRFRAEVMRLLPDAVRMAARLGIPNHPPGHWCTLDAALRRVLDPAVGLCTHDQHPVEHLGDNWPNHGCVPRRRAEPTVSILMPVYNAGAYLGRALESVFSQTFADWELLVLDDGSDDPLVEASYSWLLQQQDDRFRLHRFETTEAERQQSARYATLVNYGATQSTGRYLTYLCGDDYYATDRLERMVEALAVPGRHVVYGTQGLLNEDGELFGTRDAAQPITDDPWGWVDMNSVMHTRSSFNVAGGWDTSPEHWRDADGQFWRRLVRAGFVFYPVSGPPTDFKHYRPDSVDARVRAGLTPW